MAPKTVVYYEDGEESEFGVCVFLQMKGGRKMRKPVSERATGGASYTKTLILV